MIRGEGEDETRKEEGGSRGEERKGLRKPQSINIGVVIVLVDHSANMHNILCFNDEFHRMADSKMNQRSLLHVYLGVRIILILQ